MKNAKELLVDVITLSKSRCTYPIQGDLKYATAENFVGRVIAGYSPNARDVCLLTHTPAEMLCKVQNDLIKNYNYSLFIWDAYRPLRAVKDFADWFTKPPASAYELERKKVHYPNIEKNQLAEFGYVAGDISKHCFGATIDLTLIDLNTKQELDMGVCFDYFDELAHPSVTTPMIGEQAFENRRILAEAMQRHGFQPYDKEYWHFDHNIRETDEPLDIPITTELRGIGV